MFAKSDQPRAFCMDSREFTQAADGMPFYCNGRTFLKIDGWALPVTQLGRAGINLTETYLNQPIPISIGDTTAISCNNIKTDIPKILNTFVREDRNRVNLKTECDSLKTELAQTKSEVIKLDDANRKLGLSTLEAEKRSVTAESLCETLEFELNLKDIELKAKTEQIARLQADAQPARSSFLTSPKAKVIIPVSTIAALEITAYKMDKPKLAPSYWCRKAWGVIFSSSDANLSQPEKETASSNIGETKPIFDVSVNSEYKSVQLQGVSPNPPTDLIRPPFISVFSFIF
jgi:hypothetical protein